MVRVNERDRKDPVTPIIPIVDTVFDLAAIDLAATVKPYLGALGSRLDLMGQISLFNLATAITALRIGVPGRLTIEAPSRVGGRIEIDWQPTSRTTRDD